MAMMDVARTGLPTSATTITKLDPDQSGKAIGQAHCGPGCIIPGMQPDHELQERVEARRDDSWQ